MHNLISSMYDFCDIIDVRMRVTYLNTYLIFLSIRI